MMKPEEIRKLVAALLEIPSLKNPQGRDDVIDYLPSPIRNVIYRRTQLKADVIQIVKACAGHENGIAKLFDVLGEYEGQTSLSYQRAWQVWQEIKHREIAAPLAGPAPEPTEPPPRFRKSALDNLSDEAVKKMLHEKNLFDKKWNSSGRGIAHQYKIEPLQGEKVVIDFASGLIWQQSGSREQWNYENARKYIVDLNRDKFAGHSGWRLPTLEEALSLMEAEQKQGGLYIDPVFDSTQNWIWTGDHANMFEAWQVNFLDGYCFLGHINDRFYARAVRSA